MHTTSTLASNRRKRFALISNTGHQAASTGKNSKFFDHLEMAADLRSPLHTILGYLEILREDCDGLEDNAPDISERSASLARIHSRMAAAAHRLSLSVENLLQRQSAALGCDAIVNEEVMLRDLIANISPLLESALESKSADQKLDLRFDLSAAPAAFISDPRRIVSILSNLCLLAIESATAGCVEVVISEDNLGGRGLSTAIAIRIGVTHSHSKGVSISGFYKTERRAPFENPGESLSENFGENPGLFFGTENTVTQLIEHHVKRLDGRLNLGTNDHRRSSVEIRIPVGRHQASRGECGSVLGAAAQP